MTDSEIVAQFKALNNKVNVLQRTVDVIANDLQKDRGDLNDFTVEVARLGAQVEALRKGQVTQTEKMVDKVEEVIEPVIDETSKLKNMIKVKKVIAFKAPKFSFKFWTWFRK